MACSSPPSPAAHGRPLWSLSAVEAMELLRSGKVTPVEMVAAAEQRIQATDSLINAVPIRCFERARERAIAMQRDGHPAATKPGYLFGLPIIVKDLTAVKGLPFTKGSRLYRDKVAAQNDPLVDMLEASGAIVIGKSNVPELGAGAQTFNEVFGTTTTPWDVSCTSGGSSGGSTAALAAGQAPTTELPGLHSVSGPLARSVPDLALFLDAMAGSHPSDPLSRPAPSVSFSQAVLPGGVPLPRRIAWSLDLNGVAAVDPKVRQLFKTAVEWFRSQGCEVEEASPDVRDIDSFHGVLRAERFRPLAHMLQEPARSLTKPEIIWEVESGLALSEKEMERARHAHKHYVKRVLSFLERYDLLLLPSVIIPPFDARIRWPRTANGRSFDAYYQWQVLSYALSVAPVPALSLPIGCTQPPAGQLPLPVGLQLVGRPGGDAALLAAAAAYERAHEHCLQVPLDPRQRPHVGQGSMEQMCGRQAFDGANPGIKVSKL